MKKPLFKAILYSALALLLSDQGFFGPIELPQIGPSWKLEELSSTVSQNDKIGQIETVDHYFPGSNDYIFCKGLSCGLSDRYGAPRDYSPPDRPGNGIVRSVLRL